MNKIDRQSYQVEVYPELLLLNSERAIKKDKEHRGHKLHNHDKMPYGQGCPLWPSCFTCPGPAFCAWSGTGASNKNTNIALARWKSFFDRALERQKVGIC